MTLREWREKEGLSLRAAGQRLGWSHVRVHELEGGAVSPTIRTVDRIESLTRGAVTRLDWPKEKGMSLLREAAAVLIENQRKHEARLDWLRSLKTGDAVALTADGADCLKTVTRVMVARVQLVGFGASDRLLYVDGHARRPLRLGKWERGGKAWLRLRIDPVEEP